MPRSLLPSTHPRQIALFMKPNTPAITSQEFGFIQNIKVMLELRSTTPNTNPMLILWCILRSTKAMLVVATNLAFNS